MINFNRFGKEGGGNKFGKKSFGNRGFNDRFSGKPSMHKATCDECGSLCEVPFKPSAGKPVFCNNCFKKDGSSNFRRQDERRYDDRDSRRDSRPSMHRAICDECGDECEVPFKPAGDKPVFCHNCFKKGGDSGNNNHNKGSDQFKEKLEILNIKLDRILKILTTAKESPKIVVEKHVSEEKPVHEEHNTVSEKPEKVKEPKVKKAKKPKKV